MVLCFKCHSDINEDGPYYICSNMGPEIISVIENDIGYEVDESAQICGHCFSNFMQIMSIFTRSSRDSQSEHEEFELQHSHDQHVCIWCQSSLYRRRTHFLPEGRERHLISEQISPRIIADNSLLCYVCWVRITRIVQEEQEEVEIPQEGRANNTNICVWCLCSLNRKRSHSIPDGPERSEIISRISPREIPAGGRVCYACWVCAHRNVQRAASFDDGRQVPAHHHLNIVCASCSTSLFRRQTHALANGPVRDLVAARIHPRELPEHAFLCTTCWIQEQNHLEVQQEHVQQDIPTSTMELDEFRHTTNSSSHCFVPLCTNTGRLSVPNYLRKRILCSQKVFVTENARVCNHHKTIYNWEFLDQHDFSKSFTKDEMQSMLLLSIKDIEMQFNFETIEVMDENMLLFWTGLTKEKFFNIFNIISPALCCQNAKTALGVYLIKVRTGDSHERISSLLCLNKSSITRFLNAAREALLRLFVPLHLGLHHISREELINKNLIIPEGLFGNREEERVPIIICDGTYIYLQKSSNYLFQKKTYSLHKYRNLVKPFLLVATDGHILEVFGPYPATTSDAHIMKALFQNENGELRRFFRQNDVFILDRGFRDAVPFLENLGYKIFKPESLEAGEIQLPTIKANKSRCVTLCRWVVEVVNGRFKRDFKLFRQEYFNLAATHLMDDIRVCASIINAFHPKIENRPDAEIILRRALQRKDMPNLLAQQILSHRINRLRAQFTSINSLLPELDIFPEMTMSDLTIFALGIYQIKQARSYYGEHLRQHGSFQVEISEQLEAVSQATSSQQEPVLIRGRIKSRHQSGRTYYTYILVARQGTCWDEKIVEYYCSCIAGKRTVGCCAHTMTIVWYLGWARHQASIAAPVPFLDDILVREDLDYNE